MNERDSYVRINRDLNKALNMANDANSKVTELEKKMHSTFSYIDQRLKDHQEVLDDQTNDLKTLVEAESKRAIREEIIAEAASKRIAFFKWATPLTVSTFIAMISGLAWLFSMFANK